MKVTIGISAYNQEEYLADAIESAIQQTVSCEVIIVNDGSPDHTEEIARSYEKKYWRMTSVGTKVTSRVDIPVKVVSQVNKGLSSARNTAIMNMTGDIFLPLDSDDILMENCVEEILKVFETADADIVAPSCKCFGIGNDVIQLMPNPTLADFRTGNRIGYFSAVKKAALLEVGGYSPRMVHGYEDMHLWVNLLTKGKKIATIPEPLVLYRTKAVSMWKEAVGKHHVELMNQIYKDFPSFLPS